MFMNPSITDRVSCPPVKPPTCDDLAAKARGTVADVVRCVGSAITSRPDRMRLKSVLICLAMLALPAAAAAPHDLHPIWIQAKAGLPEGRTSVEGAALAVIQQAGNVV